MRSWICGLQDRFWAKTYLRTAYLCAKFVNGAYTHNDISCEIPHNRDKSILEVISQWNLWMPF